MPIYRYAYVDNGPEGANSLLAQGWRPVREIAATSSPQSREGQVLVLLEREDVPISGGLDLPGGQLTAADIEGLPLFTGLTSEELREIIAALEPWELEEGEALFSPGDSAPSIFIVVEGNIRISLPKLPVEEVEVLDASRLQVFGEASFFSGEPHATTALATVKTHLLRFSRERFDDLLQSGSSTATKIAVNAAALLGKRLGITDRWVWELHEEDQNLRVARSWGRFRRRMYELG